MNTDTFNLSRMRKTLINLILFSTAMGMLESAVVIYLRALYYPDGFTFPVKQLGTGILTTELVREFATLIMLACIGYIHGENRTERIAAFMFSFGVWDIFYYLFLEIFLNWPESVLSWDLLFLIPVPWIGPVLAPCIVSATMIVLYLLILHRKKTGNPVKFNRPFWLLISIGWAAILYTFISDSIRMLPIFLKNPDFDMLKDIRSFIPFSYNWILFGIGQTICMVAIARLFRNNN